ncbi:sensor histidine kinase [Cryobacterium sp. TMT4-31]|uniref:sensor histidine kinase n=1 Tax=Cryobacterium sp. TMT4-31 TaxID=1259259 RepID=UPI00106B67BE|nr:sensor histidine kinase [Cryobacterium sp. TMT4-31]TFC90171.1 sensor histidine kinase [Cryobacterium sp. TMT4-31]
MNARRWWDLIVAGSLTVLTVITIDHSWVSVGERAGGLLSLAAIGLAYLGLGRRMLRSSNPSASAGDSGFDYAAFPASARLFQITLIVSCGAATAFDPSLATAQTLAFPILWALSTSFSGAVVLSALLSVSVGLGMWVGMGSTPGAAVQAAAIEGISFVFALAMGTWISRIADAGAYQRRLVEELTLAQDELAAAQRDAGSAAERERLAREIHDTIAQSLTSLVMLTQRTRSELAAVPGDTSAVADSLDLIESTGRDALTEARALVASMSPVRAADGDLAHTVTRLAERFERETGIQVTVELTGLDAAGADPGTELPPLDRALEVVLLRCGQEGLANVRKHSGAGAARIAIARTPQEVALTVTDNGRGLGAYRPESEHGFGLTGMRDRVGLVGGRLEVTDSANGSGTVLRVTLPLLVTAPSTGGRG